MDVKRWKKGRSRGGLPRRGCNGDASLLMGHRGKTTGLKAHTHAEIGGREGVIRVANESVILSGK